jgi:hypothetical protein
VLVAALLAGCGGCGPNPRVLVPGAPSSKHCAQSLATDSANLYWTDVCAGALMQMPIAGGASSTLVGGRNATMPSIAVDPSHLYWAEDSAESLLPDGGDSYAGASVFAAPLQGGEPVLLASGQVHPFGLTSDEARVYWANTGLEAVPVGGDGGSPEGAGIWAATLDGGKASELVSTPESPLTLALANGALYWSQGDGTIDTVSASGGSPSVFASSQIAVGAIGTNGTTLFWGTQTNFGNAIPPPVGSIAESPLASSAPADLTSTTDPVGLAVSGSSIYWITGSYCSSVEGLLFGIGSNCQTGSVMMMQADGGNPETLLGLSSAPTGLVVGGTEPIWVTADGQIQTLP